MPNSRENYFELANGEIRCWLEQDASIMLKAVTPHGDPVELPAHEVDELIKVLQTLRAKL